jgi:DNA-binding NtrC family response regulator
MIKVLIVDDDASLRATVKAAFLSAPEYIVEEAGDGLEAVAKVKKATTPFNMVILDVDMPNLGGLDAMKVIKDFDPRIIVLILTAHSNIEDAVKAVRDGAYNYISKPVKQSEMLKVAELALKAHDLVEAVAAAAPTLTLESGQKFMSGSREMQKVFNIIHKLSKVSTPVLVRGESGTGKELVARAIHYNSQRKNEKNSCYQLLRHT